MNRLPVWYLPDAPELAQWLSFVGQLLEPEDIITLQEFMGYVLLPTTKGQKMMIVIGKGGEGKSRIGRVLRALLGDSMNMGSIQKVEVDRESNSITSQKQMLTQFAEYHGIEIVETYVDDGWSGTNYERPDFKRMIVDIESGKINTVITKDLSRLGRDYL